MNSITFKVKDTDITEPVLKIFDYESLLNNNKISRFNNNINSKNNSFLTNYTIKSTLKDKFNYIGNNSFVHSALECFNKHHKLVIRPDDIWMAILNMFSIFVNNNSELLRNKFVQYQDKKKLTVYTDYRILDAPLDKLIVKMKDEIKKNIIDPSITDWLVPSFTTTNENDKVVYSAMLMSSLKSYFSYEFTSFCGLPEVTLLGTVQDWMDIKLGFNKLKDYDSGTNQMNEWCKLLNPILDKFIETAQGNPDIDWWNSIAKENGRSGGTILTGWITCFLIYDIEGRFIIKNDQNQQQITLLTNHIQVHKSIKPQNDNKWLEICTSKIPNGYSSLPIILKDIDGIQYDSELYCGHLVTNSINNNTLKPSIDWCLIIKN